MFPWYKDFGWVKTVYILTWVYTIMSGMSLPIFRGITVIHSLLTIYGSMNTVLLDTTSEDESSGNTPSEDSDQPMLSQILIRIFTECILDSHRGMFFFFFFFFFFHADNEDSALTMWIRKLIWVFAGRTFQKVLCSRCVHIFSWSDYCLDR